MKSKNSRRQTCSNACRMSLSRQNNGHKVRKTIDRNEPLLLQRARVIRDYEKAKDPRAHNPLGCLCLVKLISEEQHIAGEQFARLHSRIARIKGIPNPHAKAIRLEGIGGLSLAENPDQNILDGLLSEYINMLDMLPSAEAATQLFNVAYLQEWPRWFERLDNLDLADWREIQALRDGLTALINLKKDHRAA